VGEKDLQFSFEGKTRLEAKNGPPNGGAYLRRRLKGEVREASREETLRGEGEKFYPCCVFADATKKVRRRGGRE